MKKFLAILLVTVAIFGGVAVASAASSEGTVTTFQADPGGGGH